MTDTNETPWARSVRQALSDRSLLTEHEWDSAEAIEAILIALVASGSCVASSDMTRQLSLRAVHIDHDVRQLQGGLGASHRSPAPLHERGLSLVGDLEQWVFRLGRLTFLPARRGAPLERAVFLLQIGSHAGIVPVDINMPESAVPRLHLFKGAVMFSAASLDVAFLLGGDVAISDTEGVAEVVRGERRPQYEPPDTRSARENAIAQIRARYEAHRGPTPRALTQDDIDLIARNALQLGLMPTLEIVQKVAGRGSPNATYSKLHAFFARLPAQGGVTHATGVDPALLRLWHELQQAATSASEARLAPQREALAAAEKAHDAAVVKLEGERQAMATREREAAAVADQRERLVDALQARSQELEREAAALRQAVGERERELVEARETSAHALKTLQEELQQAHLQAATTNATLAATAAERDRVVALLRPR